MPLDEKQKTELYKLYRLYSMDFDMAIRTLAVLKRYPKSSNRYRLLQEIRYSLLRDAVVSYARPFSGNRGVLFKSHSLPLKLVPREFRQLHSQLMTLRSQLFAHTDLSYRNPKVMQLGRLFPISVRAFDYESLNDEVCKLYKLISEAQHNLNLEIERLEAEHLSMSR